MRFSPYRHDASPPPHTEKRRGTSSSAEKGPLVLIVDDCVESRSMYAEYLRPAFRVAEAANGAEAVAKTLTLLPDVVVMDLTLPGMDGAQATRRIKRDDRTRQIPVLVVSGHEVPRDDAGATGAAPPWDVYVRKPCRPDVLAAQIQKLLDARARAR